MPTYEYVCEACGHAWEARQSMKDEPLSDCPNCNEPKAKRQISLGAGFILKGGGWYSDLYGNKKDKRKAGTPGDRYKDDKEKPGPSITSAPSTSSSDTGAAAASTSDSTASSTSSTSSAAASTTSGDSGGTKSSGSSD